ncbi:hypothetical protein N7466_003165 [Penicillium verhagenii]|uniref:uncharacterized protein n=1 Tax=Penicillium verhagenii TaxID=1562060 RepID=UPI002544DC96|nr:uncharacterized protein N7466_003165 [Penicillium verhagenii]KAJ5936715.1 hypothetical protein N7466_003165 [Penicillium verhagenii]
MSSNSNQHAPVIDHTSQAASNAHLDPNNGYPASDNQLAGLVEAATAAADQDQDLSHWAAAAATAVSHQHLDGYGTEMHLAEDGFGDANFGAAMGSGRHLRVPNDHSQSPGLSRTVSKKRKRNDDNLDPALAAAGISENQQHAQTSHQASLGFPGDNMDIRSAPPQSLNEARAVGVHSAAALFRQPSTNKKYTRPPMSKLFASLELSPENFLHLQAAAKGYMLNDEHPERRDCVGQRGKGDTEMVKLRLWNCVRHFLEAEGNGDRFFGENVVNEGMGPRTYIWPRDQQKIISLVIPLLRRMVTNERQRQYAIETRKVGGSDDRRRRQTNEGLQELNEEVNGATYSPDQSAQVRENNRTSDLERNIQSAPPPTHSNNSLALNPSDNSLNPSNFINIGLPQLLEDNFLFDYDEFVKSYDTMNAFGELSRLFGLSGLQESEFRGIVAAVDNHHMAIHGGPGQVCPPACEAANVQRIVEAPSTAAFNWNYGGTQAGPARTKFATFITESVSQVRNDIVEHRESTDLHRNITQQSGRGLNIVPATDPSNQLIVRLNVIREGRRVLPPFDVQADMLSSVNSVKGVIANRYMLQILDLSFGQFNADHDVADSALERATAAWTLKALLPDGLVEIDNNEDWLIAIDSIQETDWMDNKLKVLVDIGPYIER